MSGFKARLDDEGIECRRVFRLEERMTATDADLVCQAEARLVVPSYLAKGA